MGKWNLPNPEVLAFTLSRFLGSPYKSKIYKPFFEAPKNLSLIGYNTFGVSLLSRSYKSPIVPAS